MSLQPSALKTNHDLCRLRVMLARKPAKTYISLAQAWLLSSMSHLCLSKWFLTWYNTGDNQLWVQGHLPTRLADTDGQGQAASACQGDVPQEGKVSGEFFCGKEFINVVTFQVPGQARVSQNRIKVFLSQICLNIEYNFSAIHTIFICSRLLLLRESPTEMGEQMHLRRYSSRVTRWKFYFVRFQLGSAKFGV